MRQRIHGVESAQVKNDAAPTLLLLLLESFAWIKEFGNPLGTAISLHFAGKKDQVPLQAADIL